MLTIREKLPKMVRPAVQAFLRARDLKLTPDRVGVLVAFQFF